MISVCRDIHKYSYRRISGANKRFPTGIDVLKGTAERAGISNNARQKYDIFLEGHPVARPPSPEPDLPKKEDPREASK